MEQIVNIVVQNGLGVGSFIALLYFMGTSLKDIKETNEEISSSEDKDRKKRVRNSETSPNTSIKVPVSER